MDSAPITSNSPSLYRDDHLEIDVNGRSVTLDSQRMVLTRMEYKLLLHLVQNPGEIIPRQVLLIRVWGFSKGTRTRTLDVHIRNLRKKLGSYGRQYIETIWGAGYRFQPFRTQGFQGSSSSPALALTPDDCLTAALVGTI